MFRNGTFLKGGKMESTREENQVKFSCVGKGNGGQDSRAIGAGCA